MDFFKKVCIYLFLLAGVITLNSEISKSQDEDVEELPDNEERESVELDVEVTDLNNLSLEESEGDWNEINRSQDAENISDKVRIEDIVEPVSDYHYASFDRLDPFLSPDFISTVKAEVQGREGAAKDTVKKVLKEYEIPMVNILQNYRLEELVLKGIWKRGDNERRAIIMTPKKEGVIVKDGDPISAGKVIAIEKKRVTVRQYRLRKDGAREFSDKYMYLGKPIEKVAGKVKLEPGKDPIFEIELPNAVRTINNNQLKTVKPEGNIVQENQGQVETASNIEPSENIKNDAPTEPASIMNQIEKVKNNILNEPATK